MPATATLTKDRPLRALRLSIARAIVPTVGKVYSANVGDVDMQMTLDARSRNVIARAPVLFFDGECGLCNRSVRWLMAHDRRRVLRFAPLRGALAAEKLPPLPSGFEEGSAVLWDEEGVHYRSDATLRALVRLGGLCRLAGVLLLVPRAIRDRGYRLIARNRMRWFGRVDSCALLSREDRDRLLP